MGFSLFAVSSKFIRRFLSNLITRTIELVYTIESRNENEELVVG